VLKPHNKHCIIATLVCHLLLFCTAASPKTPQKALRQFLCSGMEKNSTIPQKTQYSLASCTSAHHHHSSNITFNMQRNSPAIISTNVPAELLLAPQHAHSPITIAHLLSRVCLLATCSNSNIYKVSPDFLAGAQGRIFLGPICVGPI